MNSKLIAIGNSRGIRLPKNLIGDWNDNEELYIKKIGDSILISPLKSNIIDWVKDINNLTLEAEVFEYIPNRFDLEEWEWE